MYHRCLRFKKLFEHVKNVQLYLRVLLALNFYKRYIRLLSFYYFSSKVNYLPFFDNLKKDHQQR